MPSIAFIDTEIEPKSRKILDIGSVKDNGSSFHSNSLAEFITVSKRDKIHLRTQHFQSRHKIYRKAVN